MVKVTAVFMMSIQSYLAQSWVSVVHVIRADRLPMATVGTFTPPLNTLTVSWLGLQPAPDSHPWRADFGFILISLHFSGK